MDLRDWMATEHAGSVERFVGGIEALVPLSQWKVRADDGGSSLAHLVFHTAWHADLAVSTILGGGRPILTARRAAMGLAGFAGHRGLGEAEDTELTAAIDVDALVTYDREVSVAVGELLAAVDLATLDRIPADGVHAVELAGVDPDEVPWLYRLWADKPEWWFLQWEAIGHRQNHLGEMISVRGRLGLSPF